MRVCTSVHACAVRDQHLADFVRTQIFLFPFDYLNADAHLCGRGLRPLSKKCQMKMKTYVEQRLYESLSFDFLNRYLKQTSDK